MNTRMSLHEGGAERRIAAAEDIKYGAGFTVEQLAAAEQLTGGLDIGLEGDDVATMRAQAKADLAPSAETLTFTPGQLATADAVMKGGVTPKIIKDGPTPNELNQIMSERLQVRLETAQIKAQTSKDPRDIAEMRNAQNLLNLHLKRVADATEAEQKKNAPPPEPPLPIL